MQADALASNWRFEQVDDKVFCIGTAVGLRGGTYSATGGITATTATTNTGVAKTQANVASSSWNVTSTPFSGFDNTKLNIYKIQFGYLGVANINFFIYDPNKGEFVLVHQVEWANNYTGTHIGSPNLKVGWVSASLGSTGTNLTVEGASASIFMEGDEVIKNNTFAAVDTVASVGTTLTSLLVLKNRIVYGSHFNLGRIFPITVSVDNEHNKGLVVEVIRNADIAGVLNYQYENEFNSLATIDKTGTTVTNGVLIEAFVVAANSSEGYRFN